MTESNSSNSAETDDSDDAAAAREALQASKSQRRTNTEPDPQPSADDTPEETLADSIKAAYADLDAGDVPESMTVRDENLMALFRGLQAQGELEDVTRAALEEVGVSDSDDDPTARAAAIRALVRVGLGQVAPEAMETAVDARQAYIAERESSF